MRKGLWYLLAIAVLVLGVNGYVVAQFGGEGAFGSVSNYLRQIGIDETTKTLGSSADPWTLYTTGAQLGAADATYYGDVDTDGTWKLVRDGTKLCFFRREAGSYVEKGSLDNSFHTSELHGEALAGVAGSTCWHPGTSPDADDDGYRAWIDGSGDLQLLQPNADPDIKVDHQIIKADENDLTVLPGRLDVDEIRAKDANGLKLYDDGGNGIFVKDGGNVGIGTNDPKSLFDFDGGNMRTQRYVDTGTNINLGDQSFGAGNLVAGGYNSAFGRWSLYNITSGTGNNAFGNEALQAVTTGSNNIGAGSFAGKLITAGGHNITLGYKSTYANLIGDNNISIGSYSNYLGTGSKNIIIGYNIDLPIDAGDNQLNIGNLIFGVGLDGVDKTISTGKVGIGDPTPQEALSVAGSVDVTGDVYTTAWTDYGGTSTVVGLSGTPTVNIWYKKIGNLVFVNFYISGSFNSAAASFTVPYTSKNSTNFTVRAPLQFVHDGTPDATPGMASLSPNSATVNIYRSWTGTATWSYTYTHSVQGQFWYEAQ